MNQPNTNRLKNLFILHLFGFATLFHISLNAVFSFNESGIAPAFGLGTYLLLLISKKNYSDRILRSLLLYAMNIYLLILNIESISAITLIYFTIPLIAAALLNELRAMLLLLSATVIEVLVLIFFFGQLEKTAPIQYDNLSILTFLTVIVLFTFFHTFFFSRLWQQMQDRHKSMEEALISREGYLQLFFQTAGDAMAVFDTENRVIAINPAFEKLYGWSAEDSYGKVIQPYPAEKKNIAEQQVKKLKEGHSITLHDTVDMKRDGTSFHAHLTLSPIFDKQQNVIATSLISRDITYQKESEQWLLQSEKLKLAGEIAAGVAHEIRNPMTVISGFIQIIQQDPSHPYPQYTKLIQSELERINLIISEFLVLAKPQAPVIKELSLRKLVSDIILLFSSEFNLKGIQFTEQWNSERDFKISGEEHALKQVFINLLKNAIEAMPPEGSINLSGFHSSDKMISVKITDNGSGISPEGLKRIYEPFYTTKDSGTGLGLLVSQKIIQDHGGSLVISSETGKGTIVEVILPVN
ncbi:ATP-binding protein [Planococcus beigongshangi]|uniref:ATP-binding protein n=1 Tax=Planococcus beigongshangi TaxID=2782536 RepID=UPI00193C56C4|nr:ATP-binding protein [Planococcus beigongshangi]